MSKSHLTAISRNAPSVPLRHIWKKYGPLTGIRVLDFGCGRGEDVRWLQSNGAKAYGYDIYYQPKRPSGMFSVVLCTYVLNVVDPEDTSIVINNTMKFVKKNGVAFFTVRRDIKKEGVTSKGTQQWNVELPFDIEKETKTYCIYKVVKDW